MISVVVPCYNEFDVLRPLYERLTRAAESWGTEYEVVIVDDGSDERTWNLVAELQGNDPRWRAVRFSRNFGHQTAVSAGLDYARGDCVILIDADLQDPPEQLGAFIARWREGYEVVYGVRTKRKENVFKRISYTLFYRILGALANISIPYDSGDFCLMDRKVVNVIKAMPERKRFVRGLRSWAGFRQTGIRYERDARAAGKPQYTLRKLLNLAVDGIFSFSTVPLRAATYLGFLVSVLAILGTVFTLVQRIFAEDFARIGLSPVPGFATTVIAILFLGGVQLICLGIIGEYIGRIYDEVKQRPVWVVRQTLGFDKERA